MSRVDFEEVKRSLDVETCVREWLPDGHKEGHEWIALNPTRGDSTARSFKINLNTGVWADFAMPGDKRARGGDMISLYAYLRHNGDNLAAARELRDRMTGPETHTRPAQAPGSKPPPVLVMPAPDGTPTPVFEHPRHGAPVAVYPYYDGSGQVLTYVCRFIGADGHKTFAPRTYGRPSDEGGDARWLWAGPRGEQPRPVYGQDRLAAAPTAPVIVVEGEKAADAGTDLADGRACVVAWFGGAAAAGLVDVEPLRGRHVVLWPDADALAGKDGAVLPVESQPGMLAMRKLERKLAGVAASVQVLQYVPGEQPHGWDIADLVEQGGTWADVERRIAGHVPAPKPKQTAPTATAPKPPAAATPLTMALPPFGWPDANDKGQPLSTIENLEHMLRAYGVRVRYNECSKQAEIDLPNVSTLVDNRANAGLAEVISLANRNRLPKGDIADFMGKIADSHAYSPVRDWITSQPWDGVPRWYRLAQTIVTEARHEPLRDLLLRRWMISAVATVIGRNGHTTHGVLVFQGGGGAGKTAWLRRLAPEALGAVQTGAFIDPHNKDTILTAVGHWIVELGELDGTFRKADIARLKAFVTQDRDEIRRPFARGNSKYPRRTVFAGSVNERHYLVDETGNRRWWTIRAKDIDYQHDLDMQQVWAEVATWQAAGERGWLDAGEQALLAESNAEHETVDPIRERILAAYRWDMQPATRIALGVQRTATAVLLEIGMRDPTRQQSTQAAKILTELSGEPIRAQRDIRLFQLPPKADA